jgi:D-alanyl-D-alanine carboxypeptidase/D-alanyl-D-alanine-endopeptidase (penicillin-binding protein 4)
MSKTGEAKARDRGMSVFRTARIVVAAFAIVVGTAHATSLPRPVGRAFLDAGVPLNAVSIAVQEVGASRPLFTLDPERAMSAASVMKLVTTFAALELLGRDYRWKTEAYLGGSLDSGTLNGDLILKGHGDPKITIEQWQAFMTALRAKGLSTINGDLVVDRSAFRLAPQDVAVFDGEPLKPYNVAPDALLVNFKSVRLVFAPNAKNDGVEVRAEPPLPQLTLATVPYLSEGGCDDWRTALHAAFVDRGGSARATFAGRYPASCAERDWYLALLDPQSYIHGMFTTYFHEAGGHFAGGVRDGRAPAGAAPFAVLESPPLYDIVRDVNKLSNNVMARQLFLTLATTAYPPGVTTAQAAETVKQWLSRRGLRMPGLVIENGSGLSRRERVSAGSLARLLAAADASPVREEFASSLAVAAIDGTVQRRFRNGTVAGQALLKTGSLEGVRALAGYVIDAEGRRWIIVALINHPHAARGLSALDFLVQWVYRNGATWAQMQ